MLTVQVTAPAYGPYGVGRREDGKVVLVRLAVPGDVVEAEPIRETGGFVEAAVRRVLSPSPDRRPAPCPSFPACGGCSLLHVEESAQRRLKQELVEQALRNLGCQGLVPVEPLRSAGPPLGYRQRAALQVEAEAGKSLRLGFFTFGTHTLVPLSACPVFRDELSAALGRLSRVPMDCCFTATADLVVDGAGRVMAALFLADPHPDPDDLARRLGEGASLHGCLVRSPRRKRGAWGTLCSTHNVSDDGTCAVPLVPDAFCQANGEVNRLLVRQVLDMTLLLTSDCCSRRSDSAPEVLELFAGHGNFTYPLAAAGCRVTAVETVVNLDVLPRVEGVRFRRGGAVETVRSLLKSSRRWDVVLLDPPRAGARELMPLLAALAPPRVIYVSCDPSTFARDGALLVEEGYSLARVVPFDMMPQTFHVELAALFEKS